MAAYWWTIWITHIDVHSRGRHSDKNIWNQAAYPGCTIQTAAIATRVHQCTRHGNTSTIIKGLHVSEAEAITALWWLMTPGKNWPVCLAVKEDTLHGALALPAPRELTVLGLCSPLQLSLVPQCCWYFFTALRLFQFNHLTIGTQLWTWKLNCITFLAFQIIYNLTMVHFVCNGYPIMNQ